MATTETEALQVTPETDVGEKRRNFQQSECEVKEEFENVGKLS